MAKKRTYNKDMAKNFTLPQGQPINLIAGTSAVKDGDQYNLDSGIEAQKFRTLILRQGTYKHPTDKWIWNVTTNDMIELARKGKELIAEEIEVPIQMDHEFRNYPDPEFTVGYLKDYDYDSANKVLYAINEIRGKENIEKYMTIDKLSVGVDDLTDQHGKKWGMAIQHIALTPVPVIENSGSSTRIAASLILDTEDKNMDELKNLLAKLHALLNKEVTAENAAEEVESVITASKESNLELEKKLSMSLSRVEELERPLQIDMTLVEDKREFYSQKLDQVGTDKGIGKAVIEGIKLSLLGSKESPSMTLSNSKTDLAKDMIFWLGQLPERIEYGTKTGIQRVKMSNDKTEDFSALTKEWADRINKNSNKVL